MTSDLTLPKYISEQSVDGKPFQAHKMTLPTRTRLAKRKQEIQEVRKEKRTATSKKHDQNCLKKKS